MSDTRRNMYPPTDRYSPLIRPTDEAWKTIENKFQDILTDPTIQIQQILDDYFTEHERKLFLPATQPRSLRECQEDNTERYHALFQGRFKGHPLSLATKFTMLYFGLPVEPVLSHLFDQGKPTFDVDDWEELHEAEVCPPLHFLTAHDRRNFGHDNMRGTEAHYSTIPVPASQLSGATDLEIQGSNSQSLSLRGGGGPDDDDEEDDEDGDHRMPDLRKQPTRPPFRGPGLPPRPKVFGGRGNGSSSRLPTSNRHASLFSNTPTPGRANPLNTAQSKLFAIPESTHGTGGTFNTSSPRSAAGGFFGTSTPKPAASTQPTASHAGTTAAGPRPNPSSSVAGFVPARPSGYAPLPAGSNIQSFGGGHFPPSSFGPRVQSGHGAAASSADTYAQLFGFQGRVSFNPGNLSTLQEASRKLLSLKRRDQCDVVLAHISRNGGKVERSFETTIRDISTGEVARYVDEQKSNPDCVWFTHRKGETTPTSFAPQETDFMWNLVRLRHVDGQGQENVAYLSMPNRGKFFFPEAEGSRWPTMRPWGINHYMPFMKTAQEVLVGRPEQPGQSNCDLLVSNEYGTSRSFARQWFGGLEIDHQLWSMMHPRCNGARPFTVTTHHLTEDSVIFHLPGRLTTSESLQMRHCFRREGSDDPYPEARRILETLIRNAHIPLRPSCYRIWRGTDFFSSTIYPAGSRRPVVWNHLDVNAKSQDQQTISRFIQDAVEDPTETCRFFVVQPMDVDQACIIRLGDVNSAVEDFDVDTHRMGSFKSKIRRLYEGHPEKTYEPETDSILIEPEVDERYWNQSQFVLRANASDSELAMVRRLIIASRVRVTALKDDTADYVAQLERSEWGPRYGEVTPFRREMGHPILRQPNEHFVMPPKSPRRAKHSRMEPREKTWAQQPSIFDKGVYNPAIPINAPAVEQIMRTGGTRVPMVSKAVLTSTEQRQLQSDLWTVRGMVLDRISRCPYEGCRYAYRLDQEEEFLKHLEGSHVGDRCPWCSEQLFEHWSLKQKEEHFKTKHEDVFRKVLDMPQPTSSKKKKHQLSGQAAVERAQDILSAATIVERLRPPVGPPPRPSPPTKANSKESEYRFCDRCGRDHQALNSRAERDHHDRCCVPLAEGAGRCTFCETCGDNVWKSLSDRDELAPYDEYPHRCRGTSHAGKPYCVKCGLSLKKLPDDAIDRHRELCGGFFGDVGCFCPYCQKGFVQDGVRKNVEEIRKHITDCTAKKPPNVTPFDIYPERYWDCHGQPSDSLYVGEQAANNLANVSRPRGPSRYLSHPLAWHDKPGPNPCQDPPSECTVYGCREPLFGLTPSEVLAHFETKHYGIPLPKCPLCHLSFQRPKEVREEQPELGEFEDRRLQVAHMECHVFQLWDVLAERRGPPPIVQGPFGPGHTLWDPENENALDRRDKRCPHFEKCGAMVGFMSQQQWNSHMEAAHASEDFVGSIRPDREAVMRAADEERKRQRIREGKQPIPGMPKPPRRPVTGIRPGDRPGSGNTNSAPFARPEGSRPKPSGNVPQEPGSGIEGMEGVETSHGHEVQVIDEEEQGDATDGQPEEDQEGSGSQPPKTQPRPSGPVPVTTSTAKPPTRPKPTGPVPVTTSSTKKPPKTQPKPTGPVPVPPSSTKKVPKTQPKKPKKPKKKPATAASTATPAFDPTDDMYCSRCFRKASSKIRNGDPSRKTQIDAHSDPNRSCRIPKKEGQVTYDGNGMPELPTRAGWIKKPRNFVISTLKKNFVQKHPELEETFCPTQGSNRGTVYWFQDPNNDENSDNFGLPFPGDSDEEEEEEEEEDEDQDEDDGDEDYQDNGAEDDQDDEEEEEEEEEEGEEEEEEEEEEGVGEGGEWEEYEEADENGTVQKKRRRVWRGPGLPRDPTYRDNGEEDDLSQADPSELVPESGDEGSSTGAKRKRNESGAAQTGDKTQQRQPKRPKVAAEDQNQGEDEEEA